MDKTTENRNKETELINALKKDNPDHQNVLNFLQFEFRDVCSNGDVIINDMILKYAAGERITNIGHLGYVNHIYNCYLQNTEVIPDVTQPI